MQRAPETKRHYYAAKKRERCPFGQKCACSPSPCRCCCNTMNEMYKLQVCQCVTVGAFKCTTGSKQRFIASVREDDAPSTGTKTTPVSLDNNIIFTSARTTPSSLSLPGSIRTPTPPPSHHSGAGCSKNTGKRRKTRGTVNCACVYQPG